MTAKLIVIPASLVIIVLLALLFGAVTQVLAVMPSVHAVDKHGEAAVSAAAAFLADGQCRRGPSVVMRSVSRGTEMFICFETEDDVSIHIQTTAEKRSITTIPSKDMSRPISYLRNVITRDGYHLSVEYGSLPDWFYSLLPH